MFKYKIKAEILDSKKLQNYSWPFFFFFFSQIKVYENYSYVASTEAVKYEMLMQVLAAKKKFFEAASDYYDTLTEIERENVNYGFDLNI